MLLCNQADPLRFLERMTSTENLTTLAADVEQHLDAVGKPEASRLTSTLKKESLPDQPSKVPVDLLQELVDIVMLLRSCLSKNCDGMSDVLFCSV